MYSLIEESQQAEERREVGAEEKPFLTPQDFMEILK
jgi:hypothetical protein